MRLLCCLVGLNENIYKAETYSCWLQKYVLYSKNVSIDRYVITQWDEQRTADSI
jgi:hypothetical protein